MPGDFTGGRRSSNASGALGAGRVPTLRGHPATGAGLVLVRKPPAGTVRSGTAAPCRTGGTGRTPGRPGTAHHQRPGVVANTRGRGP